MKKTKKAAPQKDKVILEIQYMVSLPRSAIEDIIYFDCANVIKELGKKIEKNASCKEKRAIAIASAVLQYVSDTWKGQFVKNSSANCQQKGKLSLAEQKKICELRKKGLSIKAIGKGIHRAEKLVAQFVKTLPPKGK